ncbi:MAG TPA: imidazole glycerol phosphate synthase cyclase subunit [Candidatus Omnitrophota bacterium]|nr:imidazole glycerol phosphate synthase cyclase subunit [Candidatus Omnitrophota bacterium]HPD84102.1 imidazole glycerol phosphate synthase cyclase subunit [Candidatus Omnitrophota bacterium]HRZ02959.1 imidazole glycerol phosphate synthase cyclase subunit [Candidatus Omnitrophota bacterium]
MLKKRLIATLIVREGIVVQSINFRRYLPVGKPAIAIEFLNSWGIDEIVLIDITASKDHSRKKYDFIEEITRKCFVPLTVGGGISSVDDIRALLGFGADKISVNSYCLAHPEFISEAAKIFGNQCIVVAIDAVGSSPSDYRVYNAAKGAVMDVSPVDWARKAEAMGAGEIYITSVDRDGSKKGFDLGLIDLVARSVKIPVIASGGAGKSSDVLDVFCRTNASAVSAANFFHFSEHSVIVTKSILRSKGVDIRLNTHADYEKSPFGDDFRLKKRSEAYLGDLLFERIEKEII